MTGYGLRVCQNEKDEPVSTNEAPSNCDKDSCKQNATGRSRGLFTKNFLRIWNNIGQMVLAFALPMMQVILFCLAVGKDPKDLRLAIVNQEMDWSTKFCPVYSNCSLKWLSCRYISTLRNDTIVKDYYATTQEAITAVKTGEAWGVLYFTNNFTDALVARMILGRDSDDETLDQSEMRVWFDMSNQQIGLLLSRDIIMAYRDFAQNLLKACGSNPKLADIPIQFNEPIYGSNNPNFKEVAAPGVILTIVFFLAVALTSSSMIIERMEGLSRNQCERITPEMLLSHISAHFFVICAQSSLVLILMIYVFEVRCQGNTLLVIILTILQGLCGMSFGYLISSLCQLERNAIQLALGSFYPALLLSGVIWPIEGMPLILRYISSCLPLTMATISLRTLLTKGWSIFEPDVYMGFISTVIWIILFLSIALVLLKFKQRR